MFKYDLLTNSIIEVPESDKELSQEELTRIDQSRQESSAKPRETSAEFWGRFVAETRSLIALKAIVEKTTGKETKFG